jgi:hypothetical protein
VKEGFWIQASTCRWYQVTDHADDIRRPDFARLLGLSEAVVHQLAAMPRRESSGPERRAILLTAMNQGLIRVRGHGASVTFEATLPLIQTVVASAPFMATNFGPLTEARFNQLPDGPSLAIHYQDLNKALDWCNLDDLCREASLFRECLRPSARS